jgi:hypothetical protein
VLVVVGSGRLSIVALDLCGWKGVSVDGSGGDSSLCLQVIDGVHWRRICFVEGIVEQALLRVDAHEHCEHWWAFVIVVGTRGMGVGCCRLSLTVVFIVVGGVVNLQDGHGCGGRKKQCYTL